MPLRLLFLFGTSVYWPSLEGVIAVNLRDFIGTLDAPHVLQHGSVIADAEMREPADRDGGKAAVVRNLLHALNPVLGRDTKCVAIKRLLQLVAVDHAYVHVHGQGRREDVGVTDGPGVSRQTVVTAAGFSDRNTGKV
jgi:hypothetical protein